MYHRGTLEEFNAWHEPINQALGYPLSPIESGKMYTQRYSNAIQNPNDDNDCIWLYGDYKDNKFSSMTREEFIELKWFSNILE